MNDYISDPLSIRVFDLSDPTNPQNYVNRGVVKGIPLCWKDDLTGITTQAIKAYLSGDHDPDDIKIVIAYCQHFIHAPCWLEARPFQAPPGAEQHIQRLRAESMQLKTARELDRWIESAISAGIDPL